MAANFDPESDPRITSMDSELEDLGVRHKALLQELHLLDLSTGCLYKRYKLVAWYWLLLQLLRKASLVTAYVMLTSRPMVQATMTCMILVLALYLQMGYEPYMPFRKQSSFAEYYGGVVAMTAKERKEAKKKAKEAAKKRTEEARAGGGGAEVGGVGAGTGAAAVAEGVQMPAEEEEQEEPDWLLPDEGAGQDTRLASARLQSGTALLVTPARTVRDGRQDSQRLSPSHRSNDRVGGGEVAEGTARGALPGGPTRRVAEAEEESSDEESDQGSEGREVGEEGAAGSRPERLPHQPAYAGEARVPPLRSPSRRRGVEMMTMRSKRSLRSPAERAEGGGGKGFPLESPHDERKDVEAGDEPQPGSGLGGSLLYLGAQEPTSGGSKVETAEELLARMRKEAREVDRMTLKERIRLQMHRMFVAAASDPNIMESVALFGALLLVICGQLYRASRLETTKEDSTTTTGGDEGGSSSFTLTSSVIYSTIVVDLAFGIVLFTTSVYMALLVFEPVITGPLARCCRRCRRKGAAAVDTEAPAVADARQRAERLSEAERRAALLHTMPSASGE